MPRLIAPAPEAVAARQESAAAFGRPVAVCAWAALLILLGINLPLFLRMGLDSDVTMWDLCTRNILRGGVHYRDAVENNFPGMLWLHLAVRSTLGWSSEALRLVDLGIVIAIAWLLLRCLRPQSSHAARAGTLFVLFAFYFSTTEWCHCQRDTWMLLPALAALHLRFRQVERLSEPAAHAREPLLERRARVHDYAPRLSIIGWAFLEGLAWTTGFWIKPFVAVPCLTCWLLSVWLTRGSEKRWGPVVADGTGLFAGGLLGGALGIAWLVSSGAWPYFVEIMVVWNREYAGYDAKEGLGWLYLAGFVVRLFPWVLIHFAAAPIALLRIWQARLRPTQPPSSASSLLAGFYLAWLFQAVVLQHLFDYVHIPAILLGVTVVMSRCLEERRAVARFGIAAFVIVGIIVTYPMVYGGRLSAWERCIQESGTPDLRDHVALNCKMNWTCLAQVRRFLEERHIHDGQLTCFSMRTTPLYQQMDLRPSTPYYFPQNALTICSRQRGQIHADFAASRQRYVVCDLFAMRSTPGELEERDPETMPLPPIWQPPSRWADKVVFRSGRYVVFAIDAADMTEWLEDSFQL
jgi:hypothetical protein